MFLDSSDLFQREADGHNFTTQRRADCKTDLFESSGVGSSEVWVQGFRVGDSV